MDQLQQSTAANKPPTIAQLKRENTQLLFRCQTVFPFTLFPTTIEVTQRRINLHYAGSFMANSLVPIMIDDVLNITASTGLVFGSIGFELRFSEKNLEPIAFLHKRDVIELKQIILGLIEVNRRHVNLDQLPKAERRQYIETIGASQQDDVTLG